VRGLAQTLHGVLGVGKRLIQEFHCRPDPVGAELLPRHLEREHSAHQALLSTVVQVTPETPAGQVRGGNHAGPRGRQLGPAPRVRDHQPDQPSSSGQ
jgi:hypothetical protein